MKFPETHLGHSFGASVPSSEEMGLFKEKKTPSQQVMTAEQFDESGLWDASNTAYTGDTEEYYMLFAEAYAQYYHETMVGNLTAKIQQLEERITELQKSDYSEI